MSGPRRSSLGTLGAALQALGAEADRRLWISLVSALVLAAAGGMLAAATPFALKLLVDAVAAITPGAGSKANVGLAMSGAVYLAMLLGSRLASDIRPLLASNVEQRVITGLRTRFFSHVLRLPMVWLCGRRTGELVHSADLAVAGAQAIMMHIIQSIVPVTVELAMMAVLLAQLQQPVLLMLLLVTAALYLAIFGFATTRLKPAVRDLSDASLALHAQLADGIAHVETIRCFGAEAQAESGLAAAALQMQSRWRRFHRLNTRTALMASSVFAATLATGLAVAADAVAQERMTVGGFVLTSVYMLQLMRPLELLGSAARDITRALGFMRPMLEILTVPAEAKSHQPTTAIATAAPERAPDLTLEGLRFGYDPRHPVIHGLDLNFPSGRTIAIVGRSGSGKSSLARLLLGLYLPQAGRILVDGCPMDTLPAAQMRALIGLVPQDAGLLHGTVKANIALGLPAASQDDIECAAKAAQIHQFIRSLPNGYDTMLGERGQTLSGGERQRIAIARALLRRPRIYVLDEPTSMLDGATEAGVNRALKTITKGCTTIVIAHRLSTVMHADEIIVLEAGQVHERGRHADLITLDGLYAQLWQQQIGGAR